jgi:hypothetical protein
MKRSRIQSGITAALAAFVVYFAMYGFRKPLSVVTFSDSFFLQSQITLKTALMVSQTLGYVISKYVGIVVCCNVRKKSIAGLLTLLIGVSYVAFLIFAMVPNDWKVLAAFLGGLPLGMVWGLIVRHLEGRQISDAMMSVLCLSFVFSTGIVKDLGKWQVESLSIPESLMPFCTSTLFLLPFLAGVVFLHRTPVPSKLDIEERGKRKPMSLAEQLKYLKSYWIGLVPLFIVYSVAAALRDFRDNYAVEILRELDVDAFAIFFQIDMPASLAILLFLGTLSCIRDNRLCLRLVLLAMAIGGSMLVFANLSFRQNWISGFAWMTINGLGIYMIFVPFNALLFERLVASVGLASTAVLGICVADACAYTFSISAQVCRDLFAGHSSQVEFLSEFGFWGGIFTCLLVPVSLFYFGGVKRGLESKR